MDYLSNHQLLTIPDNPKDYQHWLSILEANRLMPVAARQLVTEKLPTDIRIRLNEAYAQSQALWLLRKYETNRAIEILEQSPAIPFVLLKGAALANTVYPEPAQRPMNDVDFLIPSDSLDLLIERFKSYGYVEEGHTQGSDIIKQYEICFSTPRSNSRLELEFHSIFPHLPLGQESQAMTWFWSQLESFQFAGNTVKGLNPTASVLYLSSHALQQHGMAQMPLIWIYDIYLILREKAADIDWQELFDVAKVFQWEASLFYACKLAEEYFSLGLPTPMLQWISHDISKLSGIDTVRVLMNKDVTRSMRVIQFFSKLPPLRRFQYSIRLLFPSIKYMRKHYGISNNVYLPFTYLYRWYDITRDIFTTIQQNFNR